MPDDWDGRGAKGIKNKTVSMVIRFIEHVYEPSLLCYNHRGETNLRETFKACRILRQQKRKLCYRYLVVFDVVHCIYLFDYKISRKMVNQHDITRFRNYTIYNYGFQV